MKRRLRAMRTARVRLPSTSCSLTRQSSHCSISTSYLTNFTIWPSTRSIMQICLHLSNPGKRRRSFLTLMKLWLTVLILRMATLLNSPASSARSPSTSFRSSGTTKRALQRQSRLALICAQTYANASPNAQQSTRSACSLQVTKSMPML